MARGYQKLLNQLRNHLHELSGTELKVWLCHKLHEGAEGQSFPSLGLIAKECGIHPNTVSAAHTSLRTKGWLETVRYRNSTGDRFAVPVSRCTYPFVHTNTAHRKPVNSNPCEEVNPFEELGDGPVDVDRAVERERPVEADKVINHPKEEKVSRVSEVGSVATLPHPDVATSQNEMKLTMEERQVQKQRAFEEAALEPKTKPQDLFNWSQRYNRLFDDEEWNTAEEWYLELFPHATEFPEGEILTLAEVTLDMQQRYVGPVEIRNGVGFAYTNSPPNPVRNFWVWNQVHKAKKPGLVFYTVGDMARAWWSNDPRSARTQWERHDPECEDCAKVLPRYTRFDRTNYMVNA